MEYIKIALPKGRIGEEAIKMIEHLGYDCSEMSQDTRKLIFIDNVNKIQYFLVKPSDVSTYVEYGSADMGIVGKDILLEQNGKNLYELLNLGFGKCKLVVAGTKDYLEQKHKLKKIRVATKYPKIAREYYEHIKNESIEIINLSGSIELAPLVGLSEVIVDIVETGKTLQENGLVVLETITDVSAILIANRVSLKMKNKMVRSIVNGLQKQIAGYSKYE